MMINRAGKAGNAAACCLLLGLSACAFPTVAERAAKYSATDVSAFVTERITYRNTVDGVPMTLAFFNEADASQLYGPMRDLKTFCTTKGAEFQVISYNGSDAVARSPLPSPSSINSFEERLRDRQKLLIAYQRAISNGAFGNYKCVGSDKQALWWASIEPGAFIPEAPNNMLSTNKIQLLIRTRTN
jgi:hypothetical protein